MAPTNSTYHEHIAEVQWLEPSKQQIGYSTTAQIVEFINGRGDVRVADTKGEVQVGVVDANPPYIRTYADKRYTDNLLSLPRF